MRETKVQAFGSNSSSYLPPERLIFLDYLRIFAVTSVLITHLFLDDFLAALARLQPSYPLTTTSLANLLRTFFNGSSGVLVFFLVSGYVISYVLKGRPVLPFLVSRIFRIYPLYVVLVLFTYFYYDQVTPLPDLVHQLLLVGDFFGTPMAVGGVEWTLRIEVLFYLFAATLSACGLFSRYALYLLPVNFLIVIALAVAPVWPIHDVDQGSGLLTFSFPYLLLGMAVFSYQDQQISPRALLAFAVLTLAMFYTVIRIRLPLIYEGNHPWVAVLVFAIAWHYRDRWKAPRSVVYFSALTYPIYLTHSWVVREIEDALTMHFGWGNASILESIVALNLLLLLCAGLHHTIENPGIRWGRRLATRLIKKSPFGA